MANRLKMERVGASKTLDEIAELLGVSSRTVSNLESDENNENLKASQLVLLTETYGCTFEWILGLSDKRTA